MLVEAKSDGNFFFEENFSKTKKFLKVFEPHNCGALRRNFGRVSGGGKLALVSGALKLALVSGALELVLVNSAQSLALVSSGVREC